MRVLLGALGIVLVAGAGWALEGSGRQPVSDQVVRGRELYRQHCATCHTEGGTGPELTADKLSEMATARILFNFVRAAMPQDKPGTLQEQEYWDILAHILASTSFLPPGTRLGPDTVDGIRLTK